jgi:hypothetical protein
MPTTGRLFLIESFKQLPEAKRAEIFGMVEALAFIQSGEESQNSMSKKTGTVQHKRHTCPAWSPAQENY